MSGALRHRLAAAVLGAVGLALATAALVAVRSPLEQRFFAASDGLVAFALGLAFTAAVVLAVLHYGTRARRVAAAYHELHRATVQRERTEAALRESERFVRATLDAVDAGVAVLDADGVVVAVNRAWRTATLAGPVGFADVGANYLAACEAAGDGGDATSAAIAVALRGLLHGEGEPVALSTEVAGRVCLVRIARFPGHGPVRLAIAQHEVTSLVEEHRAAVARKEAELAASRASGVQALGDRERALALAERAAEAAPVATVWTDRDGVVRKANRACGPLLGWAPAALEGTSLFAVVPTLARGDWAAHVEHGAPRWLGGSVATADGRRVPVEIGVAAVRADGDEQVVVCLRDVEAAEETVRLVDERDALRDETQRVTRERDALSAETERLRREHEALREEAERTGREGDGLRAETERLRREHDALRDEAERVGREREALREEAERLRQERDGLRDETERLATERAALGADAAGLRAAVDGAPVAVFVADADGGCRFVNATWAAVTRRDGAGAPWWQAIHEADRERVVAEARRVVAEPSSAEIECRLAGDAEERWALVRLASSPRENGGPPCLVGALVDVTARRVTDDRAARELAQAGAALERAAVELRDLYDGAPCGYHSIDEHGVVVAMNATALDWLGRAREEVVGRARFAEHVAPESRTRLAEAFRALAASRLVEDVELEIVAEDGTVVPIAATAIAVRDADGRWIGSRWTSVEISERRQAAARIAALETTAERQAREVDALRAAVAETAGGLDGEADDEALAVETAGADGPPRLGIVAPPAPTADVLDGVLDFVHGGVPLDRTPVDMAALARAAVDEVRRRHPDRDVAVSVDDGLAPAVGYPMLVRHLLLHLVGNAFASTAATAHPCVDVGSVPLDGASVYYVRDNGAGFDMRDAERLFRPFEPLHGAGAFAGARVGLAVVRRIVERHGGRIWADGRVGDGATFYFTLAGEAPEQPAAPEQPRPARADA